MNRLLLCDIEPPGRDPMAAAVAAILADSGWEYGHATQVRRLSLALFDLLQQRHRLHPWFRSVLEFGAMLHDIGFQISERKHHKHSFKLIDAKLPRPRFTERQALMIALTARYHRKAEPAAGHKGFDALDLEQRRAVTALAAIIRVADGLDRTHSDSVQELGLEWLDQEIRLHVGGAGLAANIWGGERKKELFEQVFGKKLSIVPLVHDADSSPKPLAFIADIHGNLPALETVLQYLDQRGVTNIYGLGDYLVYGPWPGETLDLLRRRGVGCVLGNFDRSMLEPMPGPESFKRLKRNKRERLDSLLWTREQLSEAHIEYLRTMPEQLRFRESGVEFLLTHGSPRDIFEHVYPWTPEIELAAMLEGTGARVCVFGHTHLPMIRGLGPTLVVNPGSVGKPAHGRPQPTLALVTMERDEVHAGIRYFGYNVDKVVEAVEQRGLPGSFADMYRKGLKRPDG